MGIFDRLRKGGGEQRPSGGGLDKAALEVTPTAPRRSFVEAGIRLDRSSFFDVLSACLAPSTAVQEAGAEIVGDLPWTSISP